MNKERVSRTRFCRRTNDPVVTKIDDVHKAPKFVTKIRAAFNGPEILGSLTSADRRMVIDWLKTGAMHADSMLDFFEQFCWRLSATDFGLDRATLSAGTLHPQVAGLAWHWDRESDETAESQIHVKVMETDSFKMNPVFRVVQHGETVRCRVDDPEEQKLFPIFQELAPRGFTGYLALPLRTGGTYYNAVTFATKKPGGFSEDQMDFIDEIRLLYCLHVERHVERLIARNALSTYLGEVAGSAVLNGDIRRGTGQGLRAIIWASDMRGFTETAGRLTASEMTLVLNAYFDVLVEAINAEGGEILKFIGDGLLAVFSYSDDAGAKDAAARAVRAARAAIAGLEDLNENPPEELAGISGWHPVKSGTGLHDGQVFFGNVGGRARLDFTVIGTDVNIAARVEAMTKELGTPVLVTEAVARHLPGAERGKAYGATPLKGVTNPVGLYGPLAETVPAE